MMSSIILQENDNCIVAIQYIQDIQNTPQIFLIEIDFIIKYEYDSETQSTTFSVINGNDNILNQFRDDSFVEITDSDKIVLEGNLCALPLEKYDVDITDIFSMKELGPQVYVLPEIKNVGELLENDKIESIGDFLHDPQNVHIEYEYIMYSLSRKMYDICLDNKYVDFIKRKTQNARYIVYKTDSELIDFSETDLDIIQVYDYSMIINELNFGDNVDKLTFKAVMNKDICLTFSSNKEFSEIFNNITKNLSNKS
jgi:hypothetical protein